MNKHLKVIVSIILIMSLVLTGVILPCKINAELITLCVAASTVLLGAAISALAGAAVRTDWEATAANTASGFETLCDEFSSWWEGFSSMYTCVDGEYEISEDVTGNQKFIDSAVNVLNAYNQAYEDGAITLSLEELMNYPGTDTLSLPYRELQILGDYAAAEGFGCDVSQVARNEDGSRYINIPRLTEVTSISDFKYISGFNMIVDPSFFAHGYSRTLKNGYYNTTFVPFFVTEEEIIAVCFGEGYSESLFEINTRYKSDFSYINCYASSTQVLERNRNTIYVNFNISNTANIRINLTNAGTFTNYPVKYYSMTQNQYVTEIPSDSMAALVNVPYDSTISEIATYFQEAAATIETVQDEEELDVPISIQEKAINYAIDTDVLNSDPTIDYVPSVVDGDASVAVTADGVSVAELERTYTDLRFDVETPDSIITKFPFCIPFDIYRIFTLFASDPVAPSWTVPISNIEETDYQVNGIWYREDGTQKRTALDEEFTIDLQEFDWIANIVRWMMYIVFVLGLLILTNRLIGRG